MSDPQPNPEHIQGLGARLGLLLAQAPIPEDQKEAWLKIVPSMSPEQIDRFMAILETLAAADPKELETFAKETKAIQDKTQEQLKKEDDKAMNKLDDIEKRIDES